MKTPKSLLGILALAAGVAALAACNTTESKLPTQPTVNPYSPDIYAVTVAASRVHMHVGDDRPSDINITAARIPDGAPPPNLTIADLTTDLGNFVTMDSGIQEVTLELVGGHVHTVYFAPASPGTATLRADVLGSIGFRQIKTVP
jgi:hypothetical protein